MYLIGLTGGIATGKSTVSAMLADLGAKIIDADEITREVSMAGKPAWQKIVRQFGEGILLPDRELDRVKLGEKIFSSAKERACLNQITHPFIDQEIRRRIDLHRDEENMIVVLDIPLLFEVGWDKYVDETCVVYVSRDAQIQRLTARNGFSIAQAAARIDSQMSLEDKKQLANFVIDNNGDLVYTKRQVKDKWNELTWNRDE